MHDKKKQNVEEIKIFIDRNVDPLKYAAYDCNVDL